MNASELIDEIIDLLSDEKSAISGGLLRTKVLLRLLGKKDLAEWVNSELNGYSDKTTIPSYRVLPAHVLAQIVTYRERHMAFPVPIAHLTNEQQKSLQTASFGQSLTVLEEMASNEKNAALTRSIPLEMNSILGKSLSEGVFIEKAWCQTPIHDVKGILTQVRSRLLDFILELKESLGNMENEEDIKRKAANVDITGLFNNSVIGPNSTINIGHGNIQNVNHGVMPGDLNSLVSALTSAGLPASEIKELKLAIEEDQKRLGKPSFEGKTGSWFTNLLAKIGKGTVDVAIEVVSKTMAEYLKSNS